MENKSTKFKVSKGKPILGATINQKGVNFGVYTRNGSSVIIELYDHYFEDKPSFSYILDKKVNRTGDIWHVLLKELDRDLHMDGE